jgi:hypothetical protein
MRRNHPGMVAIPPATRYAAVREPVEEHVTSGL